MSLPPPMPINDNCYGSTLLKSSKTCDIQIVSIILSNCRSWQVICNQNTIDRRKATLILKQ